MSATMTVTANGTLKDFLKEEIPPMRMPATLSIPTCIYLRFLLGGFLLGGFDFHLEFLTLLQTSQLLFEISHCLLEGSPFFLHSTAAFSRQLILTVGVVTLATQRRRETLQFVKQDRFGIAVVVTVVAMMRHTHVVDT